MEVMEKCVSILFFFKEKRVISKNTLAQPSTPSGLSMISGALCIMGAWYLTRTEPPILTKMPGASSKMGQRDALSEILQMNLLYKGVCPEDAGAGAVGKPKPLPCADRGKLCFKMAQKCKEESVLNSQEGWFSPAKQNTLPRIG
ncbi:hypothetical protein pdam_00014408 [Pocillopora damicornis]|uniref:Uncharacterized protein n=1 Tax=Pocillopora damicornis TaxID=46731 RepID=A0A3M6U897_POCDA|nr:hypothetical protein pdam_00014408 [Pocillopora damicornis]